MFTNQKRALSVQVHAANLTDNKKKTKQKLNTKTKICVIPAVSYIHLDQQ